MESRSAQAVVNDLASLLGLPVVLEDVHQQPIVHSPHYELTDQMRMHTIMRLSTSQEVVDYFTPWGLRERREPFVVPGNPDIDILPRLCIPIRSGRGTLGYVWILLPNQQVDEEKVQAAKEAGEALRHVLLMENEVRHRETELTRTLLTAPHDERLQALSDAELRHRIGIDRPCAVLICQGPVWSDPAVRADFWSTMWGASGSDQMRAITQAEGVVVITDRSSVQELRRIHGAALVDLNRHVRANRERALVIGISDWVSSPLELPQAYREAQIAVRVSRVIRPEKPGYWLELGVFRYLGQLSAQMLVDAVDPRVRKLVDEDRNLAETVRCYLANAGAAGATAAELGVHRATLYDRLDRVTRRGLDPRNGADALTLQVGLCALDLAQYSQ